MKFAPSIAAISYLSEPLELHLFQAIRTLAKLILPEIMAFLLHSARIWFCFRIKATKNLQPSIILFFPKKIAIFTIDPPRSIKVLPIPPKKKGRSLLLRAIKKNRPLGGIPFLLSICRLYFPWPPTIFYESRGGKSYFLFPKFHRYAHFLKRHRALAW